MLTKERGQQAQEFQNSFLSEYTLPFEVLISMHTDEIPKIKVYLLNSLSQGDFLTLYD